MKKTDKIKIMLLPIAIFTVLCRRRDDKSSETSGRKIQWI